jgi:hypothetical protein
MKLVAVMVLVLACGSAQARPPFAVLLDDKAARTYDVIDRATGAATGEHVTLSVRATDKQGVYTWIDVRASADGKAEFSGMELLVGPKGVREVFIIAPENHDEKHFRDAYEHNYVPRVYLPATLRSQHFPGDIGRAADDHAYSVTGDFTKRDAHTWRMTWKGSYTVAAGQSDGTNTKIGYESIVDFDPDQGFTLLCPADHDDRQHCLRRHP